MVERLDHRPAPSEGATMNRRDVLRISAGAGFLAWTALQTKPTAAYEAEWKDVMKAKQAFVQPTVETSPEALKLLLDQAARSVFRINVRPQGKKPDGGFGFVLKAPPERLQGLRYHSKSVYLLSARHVVDDVFFDKGLAPIDIIFPRQEFKQISGIRAKQTICDGDKNSPDIAILEYPAELFKEIETSGLAIRDLEHHPFPQDTSVYSLGGDYRKHIVESEEHKIKRECVYDRKRPQAGFVIIGDNGDREPGSSGQPVIGLRATPEGIVTEVVGIHHMTDATADEFDAVHAETIVSFLDEHGIHRKFEDTDI